MTPETRQRGLMDLNTFNWKKTFLTVQQIACSAFFFLHILGQTFIYYLVFGLGSYFLKERSYPLGLKKILEAMILSGYVSLIIANIIFAISFITSFFLKYSRWLRIILKYTLKFNTIFTSIASLFLVCFTILDSLLEQGPSSNSNDWFDYSLTFVFCLYPILLFLQPCYFRYFIFYRTPIVRQRKLLWLNIVPSGILFVYLYFISLYIIAIINKTL